MEPISSAFETLAEIAGALLGFAAIAFALAPSPERLKAGDRLRLWSLLSMSVASILGGILPHVLSKLDLSGPAMWRIWSGAYLFAALQILAVGLVLYYRMSSKERSGYRGETLVIKSLVLVQEAILLAVVIAQALNALAIRFHGEEWVCLVGLLLTVVQAAIILLTIVFLRPESRTG